MSSINQFNSVYININSPKPAGLVRDNTVQNEICDNKNVMQSKSERPNTFAQSVNFCNSSAFQIEDELILKYIKSLLNMPDSIEKFIEQLNTNTDCEALLNQKARIIVENMIDVALLSKFLNENSKSALQKIFTTISQALNCGLNDTAQLRQIMDILSSLSRITSNPDCNCVKELLLLYLPFDMYTPERIYTHDTLANAQETNAEPKLSILFETVNFSNFSCELEILNNLLYIKFNSINNFPFEKCRKITEFLLNKANIRCAIENVVKKENVNTNNNSKQNFKIVSSAKLPINMVLSAHLIIKTVFKIDKDFSST